MARASKRRCTSRTAKGKPCQAWALRGRGTCLAHTPAEQREAAGLGRFGPEAGKLGGRPRKPTPTEIARELIEENELALQRPYWRTLGYDVVIGTDGPELIELEDGGVKLHGESRDGIVKMSEHEDLRAQIDAAERLMNRAYGRPMQATEISGRGGQPVELDYAPIPDDPEWHRRVAQIIFEATAETPAMKQALAEVTNKGQG
jgi:hypothetical protein